MKWLRSNTANIILMLFFACLSLNVQASTGWKVDIAPYLWAINMSGTVKVGAEQVHVDQDFSDLLKKLNFAGMLWIDAHNGPFGIFGNIDYAVISDSAHDGPVSVTAQNKFGLYSAGISYLIFQNQSRSFEIEPYAGVRYTVNDTSVTLKDLPFINIRASDNQHWADPIVGARFHFIFNRAWSAMLAGDVGGTNTVDHNSYNIVALLGYHPQTHMIKTTWYVGYRLLDQHYRTGNGSTLFDWNMKLYGPIVGVKIAI